MPAVSYRPVPGGWQAVGTVISGSLGTYLVRRRPHPSSLLPRSPGCPAPGLRISPATSSTSCCEILRGSRIMPRSQQHVHAVIQQLHGNLVLKVAVFYVRRESGRGSVGDAPPLTTQARVICAYPIPSPMSRPSGDFFAAPGARKWRKIIQNGIPADVRGSSLSQAGCITQENNDLCDGGTRAGEHHVAVGHLTPGMCRKNHHPFPTRAARIWPLVNCSSGSRRSRPT